MSQSQDTIVQPDGVKRQRKRLFCDHCDTFLPKSTYYRHKSAYFNIVTRKWTRVDSGTLTSASHHVAISELQDAFIGMMHY